LAAEVPALNFASTSVSAWLSQKDGTLGHVTAAIRNTFSAARRPGILFIDEIDSLPARGSSAQHDPWYSAVVNAVLEQIDGYEKREGLVVIAACNTPSKLDPALVRSGRLDHHIIIPLPDVPALIGILRTHLGAELAGVNLRGAALAARGHTGADVEKWVRMARQSARRASRELELNDLLDAIRGGQPEWPAGLRRRIALHEAGHAIVHLALGTAEPKSLSIGGDGGLAESTVGVIQADTRAHLESFLVALLGGRAAEQLIMKDVTAGSAGSADSDLGRCTRLAMRLEANYGLGSSLGLIALSDDLNERDLLLFEPLRAAVGKTLERAMRRH
jgi:ATP-dependent Zn protease